MIPLFIIGVAERSGTNYLYNLLKLHPEIVASHIHGEDRICNNLRTMNRFIEEVDESQPARWNNDLKELKIDLGRGIADYIKRGVNSGSYSLTKTPLPVGVQYIRDYIPDSKLILLTRDGRNIVESYTRTFNKDFYYGLHYAREGARTFIEYREQADCNKYLLVKYEDLVNSLEDVLKKIFKYLDLNHMEYPLREAEELGVIGSSTFMKTDNVKWSKAKARKKDDSFNPNQRSSHWSRWTVLQYNSYNGMTFKKLGYEIQGTGLEWLYLIAAIYCRINVKISWLIEIADQYYVKHFKTNN